MYIGHEGHVLNFFSNLVASAEKAGPVGYLIGVDQITTGTIDYGKHTIDLILTFGRDIEKVVPLPQSEISDRYFI